MTTITVTPNGRFVIKAPFHAVGLCQGIPSRRFVKSSKAWVAPVTRLNAKYLLEVFASASWDPAALAAAKAMSQEVVIRREPFPAGYQWKTIPDPHQREALTKVWGLKNHGLFMDRGTGKTKTTIDFISAKALTGEINAAVVVSPLSMVLSWRDEILVHSPIESTIVIYRGGKEKKVPCPGVELASGFTWYLISIESLSTGGTTDWTKARMSAKQAWLVVDESARIKNPQANRTKNAISLSKFAKGKSILSGLPILKGPLDLFSQLEFLDPEITGTGDFYCFRNRYAVMGGYENREIIGYQNMDELTSLIEPHVFSITKKQALTSLPDKRFKAVRVEMDDEQKKTIATIRKGALGERVLQNVLERVLRMQQAAAGFAPDGEGGWRMLVPIDKNPKVRALKDIIEGTDEQFIIWCNFHAEIRIVREALRSLSVTFVEYHGAKGPEERKDAERAFQNGSVRGFVGTVSAGGIGITLTAATLVVYFGNSWALEMREQSEDRAHRRGQKNAVLYVDLIAEGSVDELVIDALKSKRDVAEYVRDLIQEKATIRGYDNV